MSLAIINNTNNMSKMESSNQLSAIDAHRRQIIKRKVMAIGKMSRSYAVLKEHPELVKQLKNLSANGKIPFGTLATGEQGIREAIIIASTTNSPSTEFSKLKEQKDLCHVASVSSSPNNYKLAASRSEGHV